MRLITLMLVAVLLALPVVARAADEATESMTATTKAEAELGKKTAEKIEKEYKLVESPEKVGRIQQIVAKIAPRTQRPDVAYNCKILDTKALNAMALPGGIVYVTKGLLDAVESDDELAGVLAHEIAHNSLYHSKRMLERETKASIAQIATVLAAVYVNKNTNHDVSTMELLTMSELVKQSLLNGYTVDLEIEADRNAIDYLHAQGTYDPMGLYSVIQGFERMERTRPPMEMGYLKTHPDPAERKVLMEKRLKELGVTVNLWRVVNFRASAVPPVEGSDEHAVRMGEVDVVTYRVGQGDQDAAARAAASARTINRMLLRYYVQQYDIDTDTHDNQVDIRIRRVPVVTLTQEDANAAGMTLEGLAALTAHSIKDSVWRETVKRM